MIGGLIPAQDPLAKICYDFDSSSGAYRRSLLSAHSPPGGEEAASLIGSLVDSVAYNANRFLGEMKAWHRSRRLLAAAAPADANGTSSQGLDYGTGCGSGQEQLWSLKLQHETHLFLFAIALTHIVYCTITLVVSKLIVSAMHID